MKRKPHATDSITPETIRRIIEELARRDRIARRHVPFGVLTRADQHGINRRVASITGTTPEAVAKLRDLHRALTTT